jgi:hypothetical protein
MVYAEIIFVQRNSNKSLIIEVRSKRKTFLILKWIEIKILLVVHFLAPAPTLSCKRFHKLCCCLARNGKH